MRKNSNKINFTPFLETLRYFYYFLSVPVRKKISHAGYRNDVTADGQNFCSPSLIQHSLATAAFKCAAESRAPVQLTALWMHYSFSNHLLWADKRSSSYALVIPV